MTDLKSHLQTRTFLGGAIVALLLATSVQVYKRALTPSSGTSTSSSSKDGQKDDEYRKRAQKIGLSEKALLAWLNDVGGSVCLTTMKRKREYEEREMRERERGKEREYEEREREGKNMERQRQRI